MGLRVQGVSFRVQSVGCRVQGVGCRVEGAGGIRVRGGPDEEIREGCEPRHLVEDSGFRVQGSGFRVQGSGCGVWGLGFGVWGLGCGVWGEGCTAVTSTAPARKTRSWYEALTERRASACTRYATWWRISDLC